MQSIRVNKVGAFVLRKSNSGSSELLLFTHVDFPDAPIQIPGGGIDPDEEPETAIRRELLEESGLDSLPLIRKLGVSEQPSIVDSSTLVRHCYVFDGAGLPESWIHSVTGKGEDQKLRFEFRWHSIAPDFRLTGDLGYS